MRLLLVLLLSGCIHVAPSAAERFTWRARAEEARDVNDWGQCAALFTKAEASLEAARCYALAGERDAAFGTLERVARDGRVPGSELDEEEDFAALRSDARWARARAEVEAGFAARKATRHAELEALFDADQADRRPPMQEWKVVAEKDAARRVRVLVLVDAGEAKVADDFFHAAFVFQHGTTPADLGRAHAWAVRAVELDPRHDRARWLAAASLDRQLMYEKKPQKYGTQFSRNMETGQWSLWDVDPSVTDAERAQWGCPPLAKAQAKVADLNRR